MSALKNSTMEPEKMKSSIVIRRKEEMPSRVQMGIEAIANPWAIHPQVALLLADMVLSKSCRDIVEFGAGSSSTIFSSALEEVGGGSLTSYEENPEWCANAWEEVLKFSQVQSHLEHARTKLKIDARGAYFSYQSIKPTPSQYDLAFIDAPHGSLGRSGAFYFIAEAMKIGGLVIVDDVARSRDEKAVYRWLKQYPGYRLVTLDKSYGRGIAMLERVNASNTRRFILVAFLESCMEILRARKNILKVRTRSRSEIDQA
jgi:predicted O-methyltransferase YrrM